MLSSTVIVTLTIYESIALKVLNKCFGSED